MGNTKVGVGGVSKPALGMVLSSISCSRYWQGRRYTKCQRQVVLRCTRMLALKITATRSFLRAPFRNFHPKIPERSHGIHFQSPAVPMCWSVVLKPQGAILIHSSLLLLDSTLFFCTIDPFFRESEPTRNIFGSGSGRTEPGIISWRALALSFGTWNECSLESVLYPVNCD